VYIHGGYWRSLDKSDFAWIAPPFVNHGRVGGAVNYGLAPATPMEEIVRQMLRAHAWLYRQRRPAGLRPDRICLVGHSAGAHLTAMMMGAIWPAFGADLPADLVKGGLAISGIYDWSRCATRPSSGRTLRLDAKRARLAVAGAHAAGHRPAALHAVGALESGEFRRQTALIGKAWPRKPGARDPDAGLAPPERGRGTGQPGQPAVRSRRCR